MNIQNAESLRLLTSNHKYNITEVGLNPATHLKLKVSRHIPMVRDFTHQLVICPGLTPPNKSGSHKVIGKLLKVTINLTETENAKYFHTYFSG